MNPFIPQTPPICDPQLPAPYRFEQVYTRMYLLPAALARLQQVCDAFLNDVARNTGSPFRFEAIGSPTGEGLVYLEILTYGRMVSVADVAQETMGFAQQNELFFAIPVVARQADLPTGVGLFVPYCFVDNDWSLVSGRDVVGYPKSFGWFDLPSAESAAIDVLAIAKFGPNQKLERLRLLEFGPTPASAAAETREAIAELWPFGAVEDLFGRDGVIPVADDILQLLQNSAGVGFTGVALKQLRDFVDFRSACYQELTSFELTIDALRGTGPLPPTDLRLHRYDSLPIAERLGLAEANGRLRPLAAWWFDLDFGLAQPASLGAACGDGSAPRQPPPGRPPTSCWDLCAEGWRLAARATDEQLGQCREALRMLADGSYSVAESSRHLRDLCQRTWGFYADLADLWLGTLAGRRSG